MIFLRGSKTRFNLAAFVVEVQLDRHLQNKTPISTSPKPRKFLWHGKMIFQSPLPSSQPSPHSSAWAPKQCNSGEKELFEALRTHRF